MKTTNRIEEHMTEYPCLTSSRASVLEAKEFMDEMGIRHLPVVERGKIVGIISDRDLKQAELLSDSMTLIVSDFMTPDPYCVKVGTPLSTVANEMARQKYGSALVLNDVGSVVGIFTTTDGMRLLGEILVTGKPVLEATKLGIERFLTGNTLVAI